MLAEQPSFLFFAVEHPKDLLATIVGLAILLLLLYRFALPGAKTSLKDRATNVENVVRQADAQLEDMARLRDDYANRIKQIEQEQRERIAAAVRDADNARAEIIADAEEAARIVRRRGDEELDRERTRQRIILRQQMVQLTLAAAEEAVKAQNSDAVQRHLIRDFVGMVSNNGANPDSYYPTSLPISLPSVAPAIDPISKPVSVPSTPAPVAIAEPVTVPVAEAPALDFTTPNFGTESGIEVGIEDHTPAPEFKEFTPGEFTSAPTPEFTGGVDTRKSVETTSETKSETKEGGA